MSPSDDFRFLLRRRFEEGTVRTRWTPSTRAIVPEVETAVAAAWESLLARPGVNLFDGKLCRFEALRVDGDTLHVEISETGYRAVAGTNFANPHFAKTHGPAVMANPLGVSTLLHTADGFLMLGRRNAAVAYYPDRVHPFAGSMEVRPQVDVFENARRELREELGLTAQQIARVTCLGVAEDAALVHPELVFVAEATRTRPQIESALDPAEHSGTWCVAADVDAVRHAVGQPILTPISKALLTAWAEDASNPL